MPQMLAYSKAHWSSSVRGPAGGGGGNEGDLEVRMRHLLS